MKIKYLILPLLVAFLLSGIVNAQEHALLDPGLLPDSPFYFLDSLFESIGSLVTFGNLANAERHLTLAEERLAESKALAEKGDSNRATQAAQEYEERITKAVDKAEEAKAGGKDTDAVLAKIAEATLLHQETLKKVYEKVPEQAKDAIKRAMENSIRGHNTALQAVSGEKQDQIKNPPTPSEDNEMTEEKNGEKLETQEPSSESTQPTQASETPKISAPTATPPPEPEKIVQNECSRAFSPQFSKGPHYMGPLFDAHFHLPSLFDYSRAAEFGHGDIGLNSNTSPILDKDVMLAEILCTLKKESVRGIIGFGMGDEEALEETLQSAKSIRQRASGFIHIFLSPVGFSATNLRNIEASNKGLFDGYGELSFGFGGGLQQNQSPDDQNFLDIYKVAGENNLVMMMHIGAQQQAKIENILQKNPNVRFLFHGPESENFIHSVIGKYPNAYYSIDAMLIRLPRSPAALMYMVNSKDEFKTKFSQNYKTMLENTVNQWKSKIEQYPDRYMWGTDRAYKWTYDDDTSVLIEEFGRAFIGRLDFAVQEKFAYKNAEVLLNR